MENMPFYIPFGFVLTALLSGFILYKASSYSRTLLLALLAWLMIQAALSLNGFYRVSTGIPPRFILLVLPPVIAIIALFLTKRGRLFMDNFDTKTLTLLHIVRIPVELLLFGLFLHHAVPKVMTFEGHNLDIISGLSAPVIYYFGYVKPILHRKVLLLWNIACMVLLFNIVATAILSAPFAFQQMGFEQPNIALLYFPFSWLPCFVVPAVLLAHLISIRNLIYKKQYHEHSKQQHGRSI